jgi:hypothetical protein
MGFIATYDGSNFPDSANSVTPVTPSVFKHGIVASGKFIAQVVYQLTSAQLLALQTTAIQLVGAFGAGWALLPTSMSVQYKFGATAYTIANADNRFQIEYTGKTVNLLSTLATGLVDQVVNEIVTARPAVVGAIVAQTNAANLGLELKLAGTTPALTLGDGTVVVTLGYEVLVLQ